MKNQQGLTLVELMVTLAVAIILVAVGMPLFSGVASNNRATTQANTFLSAFKLARSEAVKRATGVSVCAIADPAASPITCGSNTNWGNGLLVFTDGGTAGSVDSSDERLRVFTLASAGAVATTSRSFFRFGQRGDIDGFSGTVAVELDRADTTGLSRRCLIVSGPGQVRIKRESSGEAWSCP